MAHIYEQVLAPLDWRTAYGPNLDVVQQLRGLFCFDLRLVHNRFSMLSRPRYHSQGRALER